MDLVPAAGLCPSCGVHPRLPVRVAERAHDFVGRFSTLRRIDDWLSGDGAADPILVLVGGPGSGKSALMAWLCGAGPPSPDAEIEAARQRIRDSLDAVHFCVATSARTGPPLDPARFATSVAEQLSVRLPGYGERLVANAGGKAEINVRQQAGTVGAMIGVAVEHLHAADPASVFSTVLEPLGSIAPPQGRVVILVDALDEAELWGGSITIGELLAGAIDAVDAGATVRVVVTTRPVAAVVDRFPGDAQWDLIEDAANDADDVLTYTRARFAQAAPDADASLVEAFATASQGNFLYAKTALDYWLPRLDELAPGAALDLPPGLEGIYASFLLREYGSSAGRERWKHESRPLLGVLGVAQEKLTDAQLRFILDTDDASAIRDALERCAAYLEGERPAGPFEVYHQSFREFLFDVERNPKFTVSIADANARTAGRYVEECGGAWNVCFDDYGIRNTPIHLAEAARHSQQPRRSDFVRALVSLISDAAYLTAHGERVGDPLRLLRDLRRAVEEACANDAPASIEQIFDATEAWRSCRDAQTDPGTVFDAAEEGDLDRAQRNLDIFFPEPYWRRATLLVSAWLAADSGDSGREAARALNERLADDPMHVPPLPRLEERVRAALADPAPDELAGAPLPAADAETVDQILARMRGSGASEEYIASLVDPGHASVNEELMSQLGPGREGGSEYLGGIDGPYLVGHAVAHPGEGDAPIREYIELLAANGYVLYRNRSLWALLNHVLEHPGQQWTKAVSRLVCEAALAGNRIRYSERVPIARRALEGAHGKTMVLPDLAELVEIARTEAVNIGKQAGRGQGDTWGQHRRRLSALAEALALVGPHDPATAASLLDQADALPYGFAGFESPARLALAESCHIVEPGQADRIDRALARSAEAAHCVQDPPFCARTTSRYNALERLWRAQLGAPASASDARATIQRFTAHPYAAEFSAKHIVGETYDGRQGPPIHLEFPDWARAAGDLRSLARLYERPVADFVRLNRDHGWGADQVLPIGTEVAVPDPELAPQVATFLSAVAFAAPDADPGARTRMIRSLIPLALDDPTALDVLLSRLLLVEQPSDDGFLERLPADLEIVTGVQSSPTLLVQTLDQGGSGDGQGGSGGGKGDLVDGGYTRPADGGFTPPAPSGGS